MGTEDSCAFCRGFKISRERVKLTAFTGNPEQPRHRECAARTRVELPGSLRTHLHGQGKECLHLYKCAERSRIPGQISDHHDGLGAWRRCPCSAPTLFKCHSSFLSTPGPGLLTGTDQWEVPAVIREAVGETKWPTQGLTRFCGCKALTWLRPAELDSMHTLRGLPPSLAAFQFQHQDPGHCGLFLMS